MTTRLALSEIDATLRGIALRPRMYGTTAEAVLFTALALLGTRSTLLGDPDGPEVAYGVLKAGYGFLAPQHAFLPMEQPEGGGPWIGGFIAELYARERQRVPNKQTAGERLAESVVGLLNALEDQNAIVRCEAEGCYRLAEGFPLIGDGRAGDPVCKKHVPREAKASPMVDNMIGHLDELAAALRQTYAAMEPFGRRYDPETGHPCPGSDK